jgi:hypothetical protein
MSKDKKMTVPEWDAFEVEKRAALESAKSKIEALQVRRGEMLLLIADGDEKAGKRELEAIEKESKETDIEIESLLSLLIAIPRRRALAQADEAEAIADEIERLSKMMDEVKPEIDKAAESFVMAVRKLFDVQEEMVKLNPYSLKYQTFELAIPNTLGVYLRKYNLFKFIKIGNYRDATILAGSKTGLQRSAEQLINKMRNHVQILRGENHEAFKSCPKCYGPTYPDSNSHDKWRCPNCFAEGNRS